MPWKRSILALALVPCLTVAAPAAVIYVDDSAPLTGANDGSSWQNAFLDLQDALAIAKAGDQIRVAQGVYKPAPPGGPRNASFNLVSGAIVRGGHAGFGASDPDAVDPEKFPTILSGDLNGNDGPPGNFTNYGENAYHVVRANAVVEGTRLRGVIVKGGYANDFDYPHRAGAGLLSEGGGVLDIVDCTFTFNRARAGSGVINRLSTMSVRRATFLSNWCLPQDPTTGGGGIYTSGPLTLEDCWFEDNAAGIGNGGGALSVSSAEEAIVHSTTFRGNHAENTSAGRGPAVYINCRFESNFAQWGGTTSGGRFVNCLFAGNWGSESVGGAGSPLLAVNCLFIGNQGASVGAISTGNDTELINCTIVANRSVSTQHTVSIGGIFLGGTAPPSEPRIENCIVWGNTSAEPSEVEEAQITLAGSVILQIDNSCVQGWTGSLGGVGNHGNDPNFIDPDGPDDDYGTADDNPRLRANSPCIDSGDALLLPPDTFDLDEDGDITEPLPIDLDGLPRIVNANVDSGAFEFQGIPCRADIDGDSAVDVDDLIAVILAWGACDVGHPCPADLDLNMQVDVDDLIAIILSWGPCP